MWTIHIPSAPVALEGIWEAPRDAFGIVLFVDGRGQGRQDASHQQVARTLQSHGLATVRVDLLTTDEARRAAASDSGAFDAAGLTQRLLDTTTWCLDHACAGGLPLGYFATGTGTAAALAAAARLGRRVGAVVLSGDRADLVPPATLRQVVSPALIVLGGADDDGLARSRRALAELRGEVRLEIVAGATRHLEDPGTLAEVARHAASWFDRHLRVEPALTSATPVPHARTA